MGWDEAAQGVGGTVIFPGEKAKLACADDGLRMILDRREDDVRE